LQTTDFITSQASLPSSQAFAILLIDSPGHIKDWQHVLIIEQFRPLNLLHSMLTASFMTRRIVTNATYSTADAEQSLITGGRLPSALRVSAKSHLEEADNAHRQTLLPPPELPKSHNDLVFEVCETSSTFEGHQSRPFAANTNFNR
jgi:hypothetical protein